MTINNTPDFIIDFNKVSRCSEFSAIVRLVAMEIQLESYVILGEWLSKVHDVDLEYLITESDKSYTYDDTGEAPSDGFGVLVMMLCIGEGMATPPVNEFTAAMQRFGVLLICERMHRLGVGAFNRKIATLTGEMDDTEIMQIRMDAVAEAYKLIEGTNE